MLVLMESGAGLLVIEPMNEAVWWKVVRLRGSDIVRGAYGLVVRLRGGGVVDAVEAVVVKECGEVGDG